MTVIESNFFGMLPVIAGETAGSADILLFPKDEAAALKKERENAEEATHKKLGEMKHLAKNYKIQIVPRRTIDNHINEIAANDHDEAKDNNNETSVVKTATELNLPIGSSVDFEELKAFSSDAIKYVVPVRHNPDGFGVIELFYDVALEDADSDTLEVYADVYQQLCNIIPGRDWCSRLDVTAANPEVIAYISKKFSNDGPKTDQEVSALSSKLIHSAIDRGVSDIHIYHNNPGMDSIVEFRVDKVIVTYNSFDHDTLANMLRSLFNTGSKDGDNLTGYEQTKEQKRSIEFLLNDGMGSYTIRWQGLPSDKGSKIVLRLLNNDPESIESYTFKGMGYSDRQINIIERSMVKKKGFILITGTTSSGKSTSIAKMLSTMVKTHPSWTFNTVEDPVEYKLDGVAQHPFKMGYVKNDGLDEEAHALAVFTKMLNALLRMDPDVMGVGEVRDKTTANIIKKGVNTGHKMFATLHADSVLYTFDRLKDIGLDLNTQVRPGFYSLLNYQTLISRPCDHCKVGINEARSNGMCTESLYKDLALLLGRKNLRDVIFHNPKGCPKCNSGIKGMTVCAEIIEPFPEFLHAIAEGNHSGALNSWREHNRTSGDSFDFIGATIEDHAVYKIYKGQVCPTTLTDDFGEISDINYNRGYKTELVSRSQELD